MTILFGLLTALCTIILLAALGIVGWMFWEACKFMMKGN